MLKETVFYTHSLLASCDNIGESDDWRDLTFLVDYLTYAVGKALPEHPCREGCDACCRSTEHPITELEWRPIEAFLQARGRFEAFQTAARSLPVEPPLHDCPFLQDGSCQIYPVRPLVCRGYGFFAVMVKGEETLLMCRKAGKSLHALLDREKAVPLPMWGPYRKHSLLLNGERPVKSLLRWLLDE